MTCECVEEQLSALIDAELDPQTRTEVEEHLRNCPRCAGAFRELSLLVSTSAELELIAPPERVLLALRDRVRARARRWSWLQPRNAGWVLLPALAVVLLLLIAFPHQSPKATLALSNPASESASIAAQPVVPRESGIRDSNLGALNSERRSRVAMSGLRAAPRVHRASSPAPANYAVEEMPVAQSSGPGSSEMVATDEDMTVPATDVVASLRDVQQGLEEIEAALQANPANPQVINAYRATCRKGLELRDRCAQVPK